MPGPYSHHGMAWGRKALTTSVMKSATTIKPMSVLSSGASSIRCKPGIDMELICRCRFGAVRK